MSALFPVIVHDVMAEGADCVRLQLAAAPGQGALPRFTPGAHVDVLTPCGLVRQYSLCGDADDPAVYELCIKREPTSRGGSDSLCSSVEKGMELHISPPRNAFALPAALRYVLIAGGIGITPLLSMMARLQRQGAEWELYYYTRNPDQVPFKERLLAAPYVNRVHIARGLKQGYPAALSCPEADTAIMLCGPDGFMQAVSSHAIATGWSPAQIHTEYFRPTEMAPDDEQAFEVVLARSGRSITVPPGQSIAGALMAAGIEVSLSCEQGMCGACVVPLVAGEGDHRDMVLTEDEQASSIALCCSRARTPCLTLDL
ncbi:oxidoreductase [Komagataeibacter sp. AV436]|uniref:Oxidoreductase n=1 Tax=Komagataeibacter melomenusus TaxID=2766578 RepID=A0ABX2A9S1_9PROT|nr:PDR/VanB family oxidoreductase [Komagataeibacter melomenusus]MBV1829750.1 PDR/VanB family oxidoreductase [Komagataeibacter melomenusus]NPC65050.1 oxidoreductase [Komagataeibacter melomenusus]